ncbi:MAG: hypothetical protein WAM82_00060, partial [Thermoanaerobaculia bacterium]
GEGRTAAPAAAGIVVRGAVAEGTIAATGLATEAIVSIAASAMIAGIAAIAPGIATMTAALPGPGIAHPRASSLSEWRAVPAKGW